jgi:hypothetical protein
MPQVAQHKVSAEGAQESGTVLTQDENREFLTHITRCVSSALSAPRPDERFATEPQDLICGEFEHAAKGYYRLLNVSEKEVNKRALRGVQAIEEEVNALGNSEAIQQLEYILRHPASEKLFLNGLRDKGRVGWRLKDFLQHEHARVAELEEEEVVALRFYTTSAFQQINNPLRDQERVKRGEAHPLPVTVMHISKGIKKLRAINADSDEARQGMVLWRGMKNVRPTDKFAEKGGTEVRARPRACAWLLASYFASMVYMCVMLFYVRKDMY